MRKAQCEIMMRACFMCREPGRGRKSAHRSVGSADTLHLSHGPWSHDMGHLQHMPSHTYITVCRYTSSMITACPSALDVMSTLACSSFLQLFSTAAAAQQQADGWTSSFGHQLGMQWCSLPMFIRDQISCLILQGQNAVSQRLVVAGGPVE